MSDVLAPLRSLLDGDGGAHLREEVESLLDRAVTIFWTPLRIATSPRAIKTYLSIALFLTLSSILVSVSSTAYFLFYYNYIPQISLEKPIYLDYATGRHPHAVIVLEGNGLISQQPYDVDIVLHMPRTPSNIAAGNFMLDLALIGSGSGSKTTGGSLASTSWNSIQPDFSLTSSPTSPVLHRSRRSATLPYKSTLTSLSHTLLHLPSHLLQLRDLDTSVLQIPMFERVSFARGAAKLPIYAQIQIASQASLTQSENCPPQGATAASASLNLLSRSSAAGLQTGTLQIYDAKLRFRARFGGLRYIVYNYRVLSFLTFTTVFYVLSVSSMAIAWVVLSNFASRNHADSLVTRSDVRSGPNRQQGKIKSEHDTISDQKGLDSAKSAAVTEERDADEGIKITPDSSDDDDQAMRAVDDGHHTDSSTTFPTLGRNARPLVYPAGTRRHGGIPAGERASGNEEVVVPDIKDEDGIHDAEDEDDDHNRANKNVWEDEDSQLLRASSTGLGSRTVAIKDESDDEGERTFADSGIGTSMESEQQGTGLVRRRSGRNSGDRGGTGTTRKQ